jgi:hypothetical protein
MIATRVGGTSRIITSSLPKGAGKGVRRIVTGIHRYVRDALGVGVGQPVRSALHTGKLDIAMHGQPDGGHELAVEMVFRERRDAAQRFQAQIPIEMPVDVVQHPLHSGMVVFKRRLHRLLLRGDTS